MTPAQEEQFIAVACQLAEEGMSRGDGGPFGAVIVRGGKIIGRGWNRVLASNDPTAHAEVVAIRDACKRENEYWLEGSHIFVSCEPCPMCLSAIYWARIEQLTFGASRDDAAAIGFDDARIYDEICIEPENRSLLIHRAGREEALQIMKKWPEFNTLY